MLKEIFKKLDRKTGYWLGSVVRGMTNMNTRAYWDKKLDSYGESWRDFTYEYILELLPKDADFSLLDIGCALGDGCLLLKKYFPLSKISGADFSGKAIEKAKRKTSSIDFFELDIVKNTPP